MVGYVLKGDFWMNNLLADSARPSPCGFPLSGTDNRLERFEK
jgi:hypothetical protein